jgi:hypothetical protein
LQTLVAGTVPVSFAENEADLKSRIEAKSKELEALQGQINDIQIKLDSVSSQSSLNPARFRAPNTPSRIWSSISAEVK